MKKILMTLAFLSASSFALVSQGWTPKVTVAEIYTVQSCTDNNVYSVIRTSEGQTLATGSSKSDYATIVDAAKNSVRTGKQIKLYLARDPQNGITRRIAYQYLAETGVCSSVQLVDQVIGVSE